MYRKFSWQRQARSVCLYCRIQSSKRKILDKYNVDVFLHSYEPELQQELCSLYKPVDFIFEQIPDFKQEYVNLNPIYTADSGISPTYTYQNLFSMAYSRFSVGNLKSKYEKVNNFIYDWVIFARYDISSAPHIEQIYFSPLLDSKYLYTCMFPQINAGPQDQWFYSNSKTMDCVFSLYQNLRQYFQEDSEFLNSIIHNWIDSDMNDRFSCELLYNTGPKNGERAMISRIANGHCIYKWHFYNYGLWNLRNLKFIITKSKEYQYAKYFGHPNIVKE
jgi:hypothetical protein